MPHEVRDEREAGATEVDLYAPFTSETILEVRTGTMKPLRGMTVMSGIEKAVRNGPVRVTELGLEGDEHDPTFHGGIDKAIHGYCSTHYAAWRAEFPSAADAFEPGAFGENLVTAHLNERNLCIGDVVSISRPSSCSSGESEDSSSSEDSVLLEVSLPRQPCFKLNHRFQLKNFAPNTWKTSRTGWYFRVLRGGNIQAGDTIALVERRHPEWPLERVQEYLHRNKDDTQANAALAEIDEFGAECKDAFRARVARQAAKAKREASGRDKEKGPKWRPFKVVERTRETARIASFVLEALTPLTPDDLAGGSGGESISLDPGAHAKLRLGNGLVRAYSVVDGDRNRFRLGVALEPHGRGGSRFLHERVHVGDTLQVGAITESPPRAAGAASHHVFVAAGVGITPFLNWVEQLTAIHYSCVLHYAVRSADEVPFRDRLEKLGKEVVVLYDKSAGQRLDVAGIVATMPWNSRLYFCGPQRLMDEAAREVRGRGVPEAEVHFEAFAADVSGDPFEAVVANKGGKVVQVGGEETLLESLQREGFDEVDSSCCVGNCGTCRVGLREGRVDHRGTALMEEEKGAAMLACVSRGIGRIVIEI